MNLIKIYKELTKTKDTKRKYVLYHILNKEIKERMDKLKEKILEEKNFKNVTFSDLKRTLSIMKERSTSEYDIPSIYRDLKVESFLSIVNVVAKKVELLPKEEQEIVSKYKQISPNENKTLKVTEI